MRWLLWCFCLLAESYETINNKPIIIISKQCNCSATPWYHYLTTSTLWKYTTSGTNVYAFVYTWPANDALLFGSPVPSMSSATVDLIGGASGLKWEPLKPSGVEILMPVLRPADKAKWLYVFRLRGCEWCFCFISNVFSLFDEYSVNEFKLHFVGTELFLVSPFLHMAPGLIQAVLKKTAGSHVRAVQDRILESNPVGY